MSIADWTGRLTTVGGTANEVAAITAAYYADPQPVQAALDVLVNTLSNAGLLIMLNTWRSSGGPFKAGFPSGGLPFGTGVGVLSGNPADDSAAIAAGTGRKLIPLAQLSSTQQAGDWTFALADSGTVVEGTKASAQTFTVPLNATVAFPIGTVIEVFQDGAGQITIAAAGGVTLRSDGAKVKTAAQYATVGLRQRATDEWVLSGDLA